MIKNTKSNEETLIEIIKQYFKRIQYLKNHWGQDDFPITLNNLSFSQLLGLKDSDHWDFLEEAIKNSLENKRYVDALDNINNALSYLKRKATWIILAEIPAFSNSAVLSNSYAKIPVIGGFFSDLSSSYHQQGMNKTKERLAQIDSWLKELEQLEPTIFKAFEDGIKNFFAIS